VAALACEANGSMVVPVAPSSLKENSAIKTFSSISIKEAASSSSSESESINQMMMSIMNGASKSSWPVLKIDDGFRETNIDLNENQYQKHRSNSFKQSTADSGSTVNGRGEGRKQSNPVLINNPKPVSQTPNDENSIPDNVKSALEFAGFDFNQILDMTNQARQSFAQPNVGPPSSSDLKNLAHKTKTNATTSTNNNSNGDVAADLDNEASNQETSDLITISNLRGLDIKQNVSAKVTNQIEQPRGSLSCTGLNSETSHEKV
jgi:hypothetical protein